MNPPGAFAIIDQASRQRYRRGSSRRNGDKPLRLSVGQFMPGTEDPVKPASTACRELNNNVIRFQPRASGTGARISASATPHHCQILSLSKFERPQKVAARGGMPVNVSALIFTVTLAIVGAWIVFDMATKPACASVTMCPH